MMQNIIENTNTNIIEFCNQQALQFGYEFKNGNLVHKTAQINWEVVEIGFGNKIGPFCVIGGEAQHRNYRSKGKICIGNNNVFFDGVSISQPTEISYQTNIGSRCYLMTCAVVHHDCVLEDDVTISSNVCLGGNVIVMRGANLGMNSSVHQFKTVGSFSMIGMNSCVIKGSKIKPGRKFAGTPVMDIGANSLGLSRAKISTHALKKEIERFDMYNNRLR